MKYELWDLVDDGGEIRPLSLLFKTDSFQEVYLKFNERVKICPCFIFAVNEPVDIKNKIYESPDGGNTIYEREFGEIERKQIGGMDE